MLQEKLSLTGDVAAIILPLGSFVIGLSFGAIVIATNFCTLGAIADIVNAGDYRRFRSWVLAAATALAGAQTLDAAGLVDLDASVYLRGGMNWLGALAGGLVFGFGMALAGGCPSRNLARAGAGDLKALTVLLVMGLFAFVAMGGILGPLRQAIETHTVVAFAGGRAPSLADIIPPAGGAALRLGLAGVLAVAAFAYCFADAGFRASPRHVLAGLAVGACSIAGWVVTALAHDDFALVPSAPVSVSFIRPVTESIDYLTRFTGMEGMSFGVGLVLGCLAGALLAALATGRLALRGFADPADTARNLAGAALMGVGGVLALGCSIGQGVTGVSTMAAASFLAFAAMALGAVAGVKYLERRL